MRYFIIAVALLLASTVVSVGQEPAETENFEIHRREANALKRPSTYDQVDSVRNVLGFDHRTFEKVYAAYDKYNKAVFGDENSQNSRPQGHRGGHGPGGPRGGMGQGGPSHRGDRPNFGDGAVPRPRTPKDVDFEKLEKQKSSQEEKLCKRMAKIFKNNDSLYVRWLDIRATQLQTMFPPRPSHREENQ